MTDEIFTLKSIPTIKPNEIDWDSCLCHSPGQVCKLTSFSEKTWDTFRKAAGQRNDEVNELLASYWNGGFRGSYHRRCYQIYTAKRNLSFLRKRKGNDNVREPVTCKPAKSPRTFDRTKCVICLKDKLLSDRKSKEQLRKCLTDDGLSTLKRAADEDSFLLKRLDSGYDILYHKSCYKKLTRCLYKETDTFEDDLSEFDSVFNTLALEIEQSVVKDLRVVSMSFLKGRYQKLLSEAGLDASSYKALYLQKRIEKRFGEKLSFWRTHERATQIVFNNSVPKGQIIATAFESWKASKDDNLDIPDLPTDEPKEHDLFRHVYCVAKALRRMTLTESKSSIPWPPCGNSIGEESVTIPDLLFNFFAWVLTEDQSDDPFSNSKVELADPTKRRVLSFAQDIIYDVTRAQVKPPKHISLAFLVKNLTGSAQLVKVLNRFGHSISYDMLEEAETAIAFDVAQKADDGNVCLPGHIKTGVFSTFCWDNNDLCEETLSGAGTTHCTNGIVIQKECDWCENVQEQSKRVKGNVKRAFSYSKLQSLDQFTDHSSKRNGPPEKIDCLDVNENTYVEKQLEAMKKDFCFFLSRLPFDADFFSFRESDQVIPAWTGFNMLTTSKSVPRKDVIGYLQVVDESPTDLSTVNTILKRSMALADKLDQNDVVIVFDQAIYAKALEIIWANASTFRRVVVRMGAFHIACAFIAVIGKRFSDAGLSDLLVESGVIGSSSLIGVIDGKHYNRAVRLHKLVKESLERCRWRSFGTWLESNITHSFPDETMQLTVLGILEELRKSPCTENFLQLYDCPINANILHAYRQFCSTEQGPTMTFWNSYIDMVQLLLTFIRATREGDWELHLASVREFLPWMFAYDRQNYSRYLPVYWVDMTQLPKSHPESHKNLSEGMFGVQRSSNPFSLTAVDQTIEQTLNRDTKTKGGIVGFSINKNAVQRWILNAHERAAITNSCRSLAGLNNTYASFSKETGSFRKQKDEQDVQKITCTLENWLNPFEPSDQLISLSSGVVADAKTQSDLLSAKDIGSKAADEFISNRLLKKEIPFHDPISKKSLKTFTVKTCTPKSDKNVVIKADRHLFARLLVIAQSRQLNIGEILCYELGPIPWAVATADGGLVKTTKATLTTLIEKGTEHNGVLPDDAVWIFDAMALIQSLKNIPDTFEQLASLILDSIIKNSKGSKRIDFVSDQYFQLSIKNIEQQNRSKSGMVLTKINRPDQPCPRQWKKYLSCGENKTQWVAFLLEEWSKQAHLCKLIGRVLYVSLKNECYKIFVENEVVVKEKCDELCSNQEEADTKMFLHAKHAMEEGFRSIVIKSADTDVEVLACYFQTFMFSKLFIVSGTSGKSSVVDIAAMCKLLGDDLCHALPGMHALSGCDSVSAFAGKGKSKVFEIARKNERFCQSLAILGISFEVSNQVMALIESYVCALYGYPSVSDINEVRFLVFCKSKNAQCHQLPPTKDALEKHIKRANYQTAIWKRSLDPVSELPSVDRHGWLTDTNVLRINWLVQKQASESLMLLISCGCKTSCSTRRCSCVSQGLSCTDGCKCTQQCQNKGQRDEVVEDSESDND